MSTTTGSEQRSRGVEEAISYAVGHRIRVEILASLNEAVASASKAWLSWRWFNVDAQGREDIAEEQARSWERLREIEAESTSRRAESGEKAVSIIVSSLGHERCRNASAPPLSSGTH